MTKLKFLGVGNGITLNLYNTCFVIQNDGGDFLIDTGGGIEIIKKLNEANIDLKKIKNIFISHTHTDHILGIFWIFKKIFKFDISDKIKIYCNDEVCTAIKEVSKYILPKMVMDSIYELIDFVILNDGDKYNINGIEYTFFDLHDEKGAKQYGFEFVENGKKFVFLGDNPINPILYSKVQNADYVTHEAFCLDSEEGIFHAYEKHHLTVKNVSEIMNELSVKNLILYHTEDSHGNERKKLYTAEGSQYFSGNIIVPNELEEIQIQ